MTDLLRASFQLSAVLDWRLQQRPVWSTWEPIRKQGIQYCVLLLSLMAFRQPTFLPLFHLCACLLCYFQGFFCFSSKEEGPGGMGYFILARTRTPLKLFLMPRCLWKTSSFSSNKFNTTRVYIIHFLLWLEKFLFQIIRHVLLIIFLAGIFLMREDKQKILQHISHGKFLKLSSVTFLSLLIQGAHVCRALRFQPHLFGN